MKGEENNKKINIRHISRLAVLRYCTIVHHKTTLFAAVPINWEVALGIACNVRASSRDTTFKEALV
jgi:hypothetical protein